MYYPQANRHLGAREMRRSVCALCLLLLASVQPRSLRPAARALLTVPARGRGCSAALCIAKPLPATREARVTTLQAALAEPDNLLVGGLAFYAGVADVMAFDHYGCFANMMTGNTFRTMGAIGASQWTEAAFHATLVLTYVLGVAAYRRVDMRRPGTARRAVAPAILLLFTVGLGLGRVRGRVSTP